MNKVKSGADKGDWMDPSVQRALLQAKWDEDEYKKRFEQNKKNRTSEISGSVHTGRSIHFTETRRRLVITFSILIFQNFNNLYSGLYFILFTSYVFVIQAKELNREPNEFEVFRKSHTQKNDQGQEMWVDHRSQTVTIIIFTYMHLI